MQPAKLSASTYKYLLHATIACVNTKNHSWQLNGKWLTGNRKPGDIILIILTAPWFLNTAQPCWRGNSSGTESACIVFWEHARSQCETPGNKMQRALDEVLLHSCITMPPSGGSGSRLGREVTSIGNIRESFRLGRVPSRQKGALSSFKDFIVHGIGASCE
jgi:hypothetical protein